MKLAASTGGAKPNTAPTAKLEIKNVLRESDASRFN
jgi:hypothetical protein